MHTLPKHFTNPIQKKVDAFINESREKYWDEDKILRKIKEELKEVIVEVKARKNGKLELEIGDFIFAICCLCAIKEINIDEALRKSIEKFRKRRIERSMKKKPRK